MPRRKLSPISVSRHKALKAFGLVEGSARDMDEIMLFRNEFVDAHRKDFPSDEYAAVIEDFVGVIGALLFEAEEIDPERFAPTILALAKVFPKLPEWATDYYLRAEKPSPRIRKRIHEHNKLEYLRLQDAEREGESPDGGGTPDRS